MSDSDIETFQVIGVLATLKDVVKLLSKTDSLINYINDKLATRLTYSQLLSIVDYDESILDEEVNIDFDRALHSYLYYIYNFSGPSFQYEFIIGRDSRLNWDEIEDAIDRNIGTDHPCIQEYQLQ
jgi:hypothetical protein